MTPQEERLVLELHAKWGNRWSRIARKLPGRTDNEIKNYWRTYMRKKAQETKRAATPSSTSNCHSSLSSNNRAVGSHPSKESGEESFYDTGGPNMIDSTEIKIGGDQGEQCYSMDDIWKDIALSEENVQNPVHASVRRIEEDYKFFCCHLPSPSWEYSSNSLRVMDEEESKTFLPASDQQFFSSFEKGAAFLTG